MHQRKKGICLLLLFYLILTFPATGCKDKTPPAKPAADTPLFDQDEKNGPPAEPSVPLPGELSPFTGLPVNKVFNRPYVIIVENERAARPQAGLQDAELVYEVPVEGGITRFFNFFLFPL